MSFAEATQVSAHDWGEKSDNWLDFLDLPVPLHRNLALPSFQLDTVVKRRHRTSIAIGHIGRNTGRGRGCHWRPSVVEEIGKILEVSSR